MAQHKRRKNWLQRTQVFCPICSKPCKSSSGLTRHHNAKHVQDPALGKSSDPVERREHSVLDAVPCDQDGNYLAAGTPPIPPQQKPSTDWHPFESRNQYEMADFLFAETEMAAGKVDRLMQIFAARSAPNRQPPPFDDHKDLKRHIDAIDLGSVSWERLSVTYGGEKPLRTTPWMEKEYEVWFRDPRKLIHNMLSNTEFHGEFNYKPYQEFRNGKREWSDFMSGNWSWKVSDIICEDVGLHGGMLVPIILGSDKTTVSVATGQHDYYPLYISIGNVHNNVRRAHRNAVVLLGFLAIPKASRAVERTVEFRNFRRQLFHSSISAILQPLLQYMTTPDVVRCPDEHFRRAVYSLASYIADYPEQVLLAGIVSGWCATCPASARHLDQLNGLLRSEEYTDLCIESLEPDDLWDDYGINKEIIPFTNDFPRADIHEMITPDILHQIIKGGFKDHLVTWVEEYLHLTHGKAQGERAMDDIDRRLALVPHFPGLRRFKEGRKFTQWTGDDSKALMKIYISAIEGHVPTDMIRTFTAYTDFCYLVRRNVINIDTLDQIDDAVERFVRYRNIFKTTGVREDTPKASAFSLPRQHAMVHYRQHVENFGAPNGLCSSITESKHIVAVKRPYRRTSHYNALKQMLVINERMDKLAAAHQDFKKRGMLQGSCLDEVLRQIAEEEWDTKLLEDVEGEDGEDMDIEEDLDELNLDLPMLDNDVDATATLDQGEGDEEYGPVDGPTLYNEVFLARTKARGYSTKTFWTLGLQIKQENLADLVRRFLYTQVHPVEDIDPAELDLRQCPEIWNTIKISVFHSARAMFCAPSNLCGVGGMYREVIRSTPCWKKGDIAAPRRDCVFVAKSGFEIQDGFRGLNVGRIYLFFSFSSRGTTYPCALIHWFGTYGDAPDPDTGMWITEPEYDALGHRNMAVVHLDSLVRGALLLPIFGKAFVNEELNFTQTLDAFRAFYVNKYADHHAHEIAF